MFNLFNSYNLPLPSELRLYDDLLPQPEQILDNGAEGHLSR